MTGEIAWKDLDWWRSKIVRGAQNHRHGGLRGFGPVAARHAVRLLDQLVNAGPSYRVAASTLSEFSNCVGLSSKFVPRAVAMLARSGLVRAQLLPSPRITLLPDRLPRRPLQMRSLQKTLRAVEAASRPHRARLSPWCRQSSELGHALPRTQSRGLGRFRSGVLTPLSWSPRGSANRCQISTRAVLARRQRPRACRPDTVVKRLAWPSACPTTGSSRPRLAWLAAAADPCVGLREGWPRSSGLGSEVLRLQGG